MDWGQVLRILHACGLVALRISKSSRVFAAEISHQYSIMFKILKFIKMIPNIPFATKEHLRDSILISELSLSDETLRKSVIASTHRPNKFKSDQKVDQSSVGDTFCGRLLLPR